MGRSGRVGVGRSGRVGVGSNDSGGKSKNHLIKGGGPADQFYECICYKLNFF